MKQGFSTGVVALIAMLAGFWCASAAAEVYKVVDPASGKIIFTDTPPSGQQREVLDLPDVNTQQATPPPPKPERDPAPSTQVSYKRIAIVQPGNDTTIPPGQLDVVIQISTDPSLQEGNLIRVLFDGKPLGKASSSTSHVINQLERGSHQIVAEVIDSKGRVLKQSAITTIHVKRAQAPKKTAK
jgi:hypothetical protein